MKKYIDEKMITAGVKRLRSFIAQEFRTKKEVSLVLIIHKFDWKEHAIPWLQELNGALSGFVCRAIPRKDDIVLKKTDNINTPVVLNEKEYEFLVENYYRLMQHI